MARSRRKVGQILLRWGVIQAPQLEECINVSRDTGKRLGEVLIELGYAKEHDVAKALASQFGLEFVDLEGQGAMQASQIELLPEEIVTRYHVLPLSKEGNKLKVLVHDPMDLELMDLLRFRTSAEIEIALGAKSQIKKTIQSLISGEEIDSGLQAIMEDEDATSGIDGPTAAAQAQAAEDAPIIRLVGKIISDAVNSRASDIHIEPMEDRVRLRYRIDGVCHERDNMPKRMQSAILTRLKIMAGMKIQERRLPQDGRIKMKIKGKVIDFRVSACPSVHGESFVLRVLRPDSVKVGLENLGFQSDTMDLFNKIIRRPNGIFLVTGPTGSGKTTTLYSALDVLNRPDKKIITAEDPVEYNFPGVNQCQIREDIGFTFDKVLRAMLRQAPNIVLVGEIRDKEVADVATQAALTGHLVFSTLHTNDAPGAITRLIDMGVKPFLVASAVQAIMAQRLIRVLCPQCKEPDPNPNKTYLRLCGITPEEAAAGNIHKPVGCPNCSNTGYKGRRAIFEFLVMNNEIRELTFKRAPITEIRKAAELGGMRPLVGDGKMKVLDGVTAPEEIAKVAQVDELVTDLDEEATV